MRITLFTLRHCLIIFLMFVCNAQLLAEVTPVKTLFPGHPIRSIAFSPDSNFIASAGDASAKLWNITDGKAIHRFSHYYKGRSGNYLDSTAMAVAFSPDGEILAVGFQHGVRLYDVVSGDRIVHFDAYTPFNITFSPNGRFLTYGSGTSRGYVRIRDVVDGSEYKSWQAHDNTIRGISFSPDGNLLASSSGGRLIIWDAASGESRRKLSGGYYSLAFSPDGKLIAYDDKNGDIALWDTLKRDQHSVLDVNSRDISSYSYFLYSI